MSFLVDFDLFQAEGARVNWAMNADRLGIDPGTVDNWPGSTDLGLLELRWLVSAAMGMPTEPFTVWARPMADSKPSHLSFDTSVLQSFQGSRLVDWQGTMAVVEVDVNGPAGPVLGFIQTPDLTKFVVLVEAPGGASTVRLRAAAMDGLILAPGIVVNDVRGISVVDMVRGPGWEPFELVGLPVDPVEWNAVQNHAQAQGLVSDLVSPREAARRRLKRGAPPIGWSPTLQTGFPAPDWSAPDFDLLIDEVNQETLSRLKGIMASFPPNQQGSQLATIPIASPENASGAHMSASSQPAEVPPLGLMLMGAGSDPFLSLVLGFGTAYPLEGQLDSQPFPELSTFDFMVTGRWEKGLNGASGPVEYAAVVPMPGQASPPPAPTNPEILLMGYLSPQQTDGSWRCSTRMAWERPLPMHLARTRSFAVARLGLSPAEAPEALLSPRDSGGFVPLMVNEADTEDPEHWRLHGVDRELPIPANPGHRVMKYGAAHQDIYGQWSGWTAIDNSIQQPPVAPVRIVSAELRASLPPLVGSLCPGELVIEFFWDWHVRRPQAIHFAGRLYAAAKHGQPPPDTSVPPGLQRSLGGPFPLFIIPFNNDSPSDQSLDIIALNVSGDQEVSFGPAQSMEGRRYRITIPGFTLDFGATGHIGLALWARGQERIAPHRVGAWSEQPNVITVSDPRPPVVEADIVTLASLPDADGVCHARLSWQPTAGAAGYFIYESTETKILRANSLPEPTPNLTLSQRLTTLKNAFNGNPSKREFTRKNAQLIKSTSTDITLPRGSTAIHVFVALAVSAGQVESDWPSGTDAGEALRSFAAPRVQIPAAPTLEAKMIVDDSTSPAKYKAQIEIETRKGARVARVDLHRVRVDDAAKELNTMGPPVQQIEATTPGWVIKEVSDDLGSHLQYLRGFDAPQGSWKRVWYRAAAWSKPDDLRGTLAGRSPASNAFWVVIPPDNPPDLSPISVDWPTGGGAADVLLKWSSHAPLEPTPLGPHNTAVHARLAGAAPGTDPLIEVFTPLNKLEKAEPSSGSGIWQAPGEQPYQYRALIRRSNLAQVVLCAVRIIDPLGRTSEQLVTIGAGPVLPAPQLFDFQHHTGTPPPGVHFSWKSDAPLETGGAGPYMLRIQANRPPLVVIFGVTIPLPPIIIEMALGQIKLDKPGPELPVLDEVILRRLPGDGPVHDYYILSKVALTSLDLRLTAPDGRVSEHTEIF